MWNRYNIMYISLTFLSRRYQMTKKLATPSVIDSRINSVEKLIQKSITVIPDRLHNDIFGDFLINARPKKLIQNVTTDCNAFLTLSNDMQNLIQPRSSVLAVIKSSRNEKETRQLLWKSLQTQQHQKNRYHIVFSHFWKEILEYVNNSGCHCCVEDGIRGTALQFPHSIPRLDVEDMLGGVPYVVHTRLELMGIDVDRESICGIWWLYGGLDPKISHPLRNDVDGIVNWVATYKNYTVSERERMVHKALRDNGCEHFIQYEKCIEWINGNMLKDLEDLIGLLMIIDAFDPKPQNKKFNHFIFSQFHDRLTSFAPGDWIKHAKKLVVQLVDYYDWQHFFHEIDTDSDDSDF